MISTHTPARGVTEWFQEIDDLGMYFYSHAREGRDLKTIYAVPRRRNFYSHAREGRDGTTAMSTKEVGTFYSHAREGRDHGRRRVRQPVPDFYSHAREGRDSEYAREIMREMEFLLTRPRGA